jgi:dihydrofolate reductase
MKSTRKVIIKCGISLDGYLAKPDGDLSFLSVVHQQPGEDYGYGEFVKTIDTVVIGRKTYDTVIKIGHVYETAKKIYVITRTARPDSGKYTFYSGDPAALILKLLEEPGKNIYCDGGAEIINILLAHKLVDELIISFIPVLLGDGIRLFKEGGVQQSLKLITVQQFESGLAQLHYSKN